MVVCKRFKIILKLEKKNKADRQLCRVDHSSSVTSNQTQGRADDMVCLISDKSERPPTPEFAEPPFLSSTREGVINITWDAITVGVLNLPFRTLCSYLKLLDVKKDIGLVVETILHFSLKIYGLPECRDEDLPLAVYFFIEDTFDIKSKIEMCVKLKEDGHSNVIGVVFETINMKYSVLKNDVLLEDTEVRMRDNKDLKWLREGLLLRESALSSEVSLT